MEIKYLEHTADVKFIAKGDTLEEAFMAAGIATFGVMTDCSKVSAVFEEKISVTGKDKKALLYAFLEELLFLLDTKGFLLNSFKSLSIDGDKLIAVAVGDTDVDKYDVSGDVKAVTYNEMEIGENSVQVVLDI